MRFGKRGKANNRSGIIYSANITLSSILEASYGYSIDQYQALHQL